MLSSNWTHRILAAFLIALPVAPVLWDYVYPSGYARWLLADAANQYDSGNVEKAQRLLARAYELSPEISRDPNFWQQLGRIEFSTDSLNSDSSVWKQLIRKISNPDQKADAATQVAQLMLERKMYSNAVAIMQEFFPSLKKRNSLQNNLIAYTRSLANQDLDRALEEIDAALQEGKNESFLDTKAWILHRMGRNDEALVAIDRSVEMLMERFETNSVLEPLLTSMKELLVEGAPEDPQEAAPAPAESSQEKQESGVGWAYQRLQEKFPWMVRFQNEYQTMATVRYHRLRILEALGDTERAKEDLQWLQAFSPKPWDSLD